MGGLPSAPESAPGVHIVSHFKYHQQRTRSGFSMVEMVIVLVMMAVVMRMALPRLNTGMYRADAAAQQVRSVFQTAQRTSLTGQHDVIVSFDTVKTELQIAEDANNDGQIQASEIKFWRPTGDGNSFSVPPSGSARRPCRRRSSVRSSRAWNSLPSVTFHRDGSTSSDVEVYVKNVFKGRTDFRLVTLTRATGRTDLYRMAGTSTSAKWQVVQ